ncbi:protein-disulfide reductase DsbD [Paracoccus actinidiae]|uniref:protein-disulfide reductase DsbD n=1 Tax=Paracoccus actinidiae TaxID=3064531 RepID=UPI0027D329A7|nr:protein-disulfide reductase DsbD [Paracoccus sp. M09]
MMIRILLAAITAWTMATGVALAQPGPPLDPAEAFALTITPAPSGDLQIVWDVQPGYYLYRSKIEAQGPDGSLLPLTLPDGETYDDPWMGRDEIYRTPVAITIAAPQGPTVLHWQGCQQDGICYAPQQAVLEADGTIRAEEAAEDDPFGSWQADGDAVQPSGSSADDTDTPSQTGLTLAEGDGLVAGLAGRGGVLLVLVGFFGFGLLLSLTPCVLPMVPIVAGMLTRQGQGLTAWRGLALTGAYVTAMATAFGVLGVVAAWSGANLQAVLQSPAAIGVTAAIFVMLALSMFGLFELQMPAVWQARLSRGTSATASLGGAAALGFGSALIVGPCVTAPLAGALIYIAQTGDVALGAAALFALGLGQGVPLLAVGAFGPHILPRRGAWMERVKLAFGVVFLGMAIWLAGRILPGPVILVLWSVLLTGCGVALGALDRLTPGMPRTARVASAAGLLLVFAGLIQGIGAAMGADDPTRPLAPLAGRTTQAVAEPMPFQTVTSQTALETALSGTQPALIYVTADWCVTCRAIERGPMSDPQVASALQDVTRIKVDVTDFTAEAQAVMKTLAAAGPPTMIFVDAAGTEAQGSRLIGDVETPQLLASIAQVAP